MEGYRAHVASLTAGLPEAGGIAFCTVYLKGMPINVTARGTNPYDAIASLITGIRLSQEAMGIALERVVPSAPKQSEVDEAFPPINTGEATVSWRMKSGALDMDKGKLHLIVPPGLAEPNEIACPIHQGKTLKRRVKKDGTGNPWLSHKEGDDWCSAYYEHA